MKVSSLREALSKLPDNSVLERDDEAGKWDVYLDDKWIGGMWYETLEFYPAEKVYTWRGKGF